LDHLAAGSVDKAAESVTSVLLATRLRMLTQDAARHYIGSLGITSVEPGTLLMPVARSLSLLLEWDLQRQPSVFVLEREQLQRLRQEESLTGRELSLRRASVQLAGTIRRIDDGNGVEIKLELKRLDGTGSAKFTVKVDSIEPSEIRQALSQAVLSQLSSDLPPAVDASPIDEMAQIRLRRDWLAPNRRGEEAFRHADAAIALDPLENDFRRHIQIHNSYAKGKLGRRIFDEALPIVIRVQEVRSQLNSFLLRNEDFAGPLVFSFEPHIDLPNDKNLERRLPLKHQFDAIRQAEYQRVYKFRKQHGESTLPLVIQNLRFCASVAETSKQFNETAMPLLDEALAELKQPTLPEEFRSEMQQQLFVALIELSARIEDEKRRAGIHWFTKCERPWDIALIRPFFDRLATNDDIDLQIVGHHGLIRVPGDEGLKSADRMVELFIERPKPPEFQLRFALWRALDRLQGTPSLETMFERIYGSSDTAPDPVVFARLGAPMVNQLNQFMFRADRDTQVSWGNHLYKLLASETGELLEPQLVVRMDQTARRFIDGRPLGKQMADSPSLRRPTAAEGLWTQYRQIELPLSPGPKRFSRGGKIVQPSHLMGVTFDSTEAPGRIPIPDQLVLSWWSSNRQIALHRYRLSDGQHSQFGKVPGFGQMPFHSGLPVVNFGDAWFTATRFEGLAGLVNGQSVNLGESAGGPGDLISDIAWFEDSLLVSSPGSLMRYSPKTGRFETLMSSLSKEDSGQFDGGKSWKMDGMTVDASTRSVWMRVRSVDDDRRGIWKCEMNDAGNLSFRRVVDYPLNSCSPVTAAGEWLYFNRGGQWHRIHRKTETVEALPAYRSIPPEMAQSLWRGRLVIVNDHIIMARSKSIFSPDGKVHVLRDPTQWSQLLPTENGFIAVSLGPYRSRNQHLWRFERLTEQSSVSPSNSKK